MDFLLKDMQQRLEAQRGRRLDSQPSTKTLLADPGRFTLEAYALLHAGRDLKDPRYCIFRSDQMSLAVSVLEKEEIDATYTTALQALALAELPQLPEVKEAISKAARRLEGAIGNQGGYTYGGQSGKCGA